MSAPRGRKFTSVVNLCGGFHPRSPSLGNKYESLARGCSTSRLCVIPRSRPGLDIRRCAIRPDFRGKLKFPFAVHNDTTRILAMANACEISRIYPYPRSELHSWPGISPETSAATPLACLLSKEYFSPFLAISLLWLSNAAHNHRSLLPARRSEASLHQASDGLKANKRRYEFVYDDHRRSLLVSLTFLCTIWYRASWRLPPISHGSTRRSESPRRNWLRRISVRDGY